MLWYNWTYIMYTDKITIYFHTRLSRILTLVIISGIFIDSSLIFNESSSRYINSITDESKSNQLCSHWIQILKTNGRFQNGVRNVIIIEYKSSYRILEVVNWNVNFSSWGNLSEMNSAKNKPSNNGFNEPNWPVKFNRDREKWIRYTIVFVTA